MKIAIVDVLGLCYDGTTLSKQGLGGSESAVILISKELVKLGFEVDVYNNCNDSKSSSGVYDGVRYIDHTEYKGSYPTYDVFISSRSVFPFFSGHQYVQMAMNSRHRVLWMHDTFCQGDEHIETMVTTGIINEIFTLSDWHTSYITTCTHGPKRMFEVLKKYVWQTRNGAVKRIDEVDLSKKDRDRFVYNASATKGLLPLLKNIWPEVKRHIPTAKLTCIGGFYRFREGAEPDEQEKTVRDLMNNQDILNMDVTFTGVISQDEIAKILANANFMLYPADFPETFGISSLESLLYKTPLITSNFGALEETAVDLACYKIDYPAVPNVVYPHINTEEQTRKYVETVVNAYHNTYLHQQKQNYCDVVADVAGWDTVALQWKQHLYSKLDEPLPVGDYINVSRINDKVSRVFGRRFQNREQITEYKTYGPQKKIVVVSPFWNAENYIKRHILSVAQQHYDNYEHILIDDASTDNSVKVASETILSLPHGIQKKFTIVKNPSNMGAIYNQLAMIDEILDEEESIVMLLDGDDWLVNNNTLFHFYNDLYSSGYDFTYGSMWSLADNIPLIAQDYPKEVKETKSYRNHKFNWGIPYTHLRTFKSTLAFTLNPEVFKVDGEWMKAGADNPLFYELIERAENPIAVKEIMVNYNDKNPLNDYKIRAEEQNKNANMASQQTQSKDKFSVVIPTMWRELTVFNVALQGYLDHPLVGEVIIINNDKDKTPDWEMLSHSKIRMYNMNQNVFVNPAWNFGVLVSNNDKIIIANDDIRFDTKLIDKIYPRIIPSNGVHGIISGEPQFNHPEFTSNDIDFMEWEPGIIIHSFGQLMFLHKSNWTPIPEGLNVYFGDDVIFRWHLCKNLKNYLIYNIDFYSPMAATSSDKSITGGRYEIEHPIYVEWENKVLNKISIEEEYIKAKSIPSDINEHIEVLKAYSDQCETVTEFGVRTGVSSRGILASNAKKIRSYDLMLDENVASLFAAASQSKDVRYIQGDTLAIDIEPTDLLFIDTDHTYYQLKSELNRHHSKVNKFIAFHDTHTYGVKQDDMNDTGLIPAILEFMTEHPEWKIDYYSTNNNGFMVLKKQQTSVKKKILIAVPTNKYVETETLKSIYDLDVPEGYETELQFFYGYQVDQIRNLIAEWAKHYDYLFSVDSDIVLPKDSLRKMIDADKPLVSGLYIQRIPNTHTLELYKDTGNGGSTNIPYEEIQGKGLVPIAGCGFGCALIKGEVFRNMDYPHFYYKSALNHKDTVSEDVYFCAKARKLGYELYADASIICDHIGNTKFVVGNLPKPPVPSKTHVQQIAEMDLLPETHAQYLKDMNVNPSVIYDIGASLLHWTRKAKDAWPNAQYFLADATETTREFLAASGHPYYLGVLSDEDGKLLNFYEDPQNPGGNSYYKENTPFYNESHAKPRISLTLDTVTAQLPKPDLIKIDVQGAELDILRGGKECLANAKDVILEAQHVDYNIGAPKFEEVIDFMKENGFDLVARFCYTDVDADYHFKRVS